MSGELESRIKEQRSIEATQKGLMGPSGKLGYILKYLGEPIIRQSQGGAYYNPGKPIDFWSLEDEEQDPFAMPGGTPTEIMEGIRTVDAGESDDPEGWEWAEPRDRVPETTTTIGQIFSGLSQGMHLEIRYSNFEKELIVDYKGHLVYKEIRGELAAYIPLEEWEEKINEFFEIAREKAKTVRKVIKAERKAKGEKEKQTWLREIAKKWGFRV